MSAERWTFTASGHESVARAFRSIGEAAEDAGRKSGSAFSKMPRAQARAADGVAKAGRKQDKAQAARIRASERRQKERRMRIKRADDRELRDLERKLAKEQRIEERAQKKKQRTEERAAKRSAMLADRDRARRVDDRRSLGRRAFGRGVGAIAGLGRRAIRGAMVGAAVVGAVGFKALKDSTNLQGRSRALVTKGSAVGELDPTDVRKRIEGSALATPGAKSDDVATGIENFVSKTGELKAALDFSDVFAQISVASGASAADIGAAAADLFQKFDITTVDEMSKSLSVLAVQGKRGAFEIADAAAQFPKMAAAAKRFGLDGTDGLATLGGLSQIAFQGTGDANSASTAVENLFKAFVDKADLIKKSTGTNVFTDKTRTKARDVKDLIVETIGGAKGDQVKLNKIFGTRGTRAISPLLATFNDTFRGTSGSEDEKTAAGMKALRKEIEKSMDATGAKSEIERDAAFMSQTTSNQLTAAWETVKAKIGDAGPAFGQLATNLAGFAAGIDWGAVGDAFLGLGNAAMGLAEEFGGPVKAALTTFGEFVASIYKKFDKNDPRGDIRFDEFNGANRKNRYVTKETSIVEGAAEEGSVAFPYRAPGMVLLPGDSGAPEYTPENYPSLIKNHGVIDTTSVDPIDNLINAPGVAAPTDGAFAGAQATATTGTGEVQAAVSALADAMSGGAGDVDKQLAGINAAIAKLAAAIQAGADTVGNAGGGSGGGPPATIDHL